MDDNNKILRKDVVYKTILRDFRKYMISEFNTQFNFIKRKRYRDELFYCECLRDFLFSKFEDQVDNIK